MKEESGIRRLIRRVPLLVIIIRFSRSSWMNLRDHWELWYLNSIKHSTPPIPPLILRHRVGADGIKIPVFLSHGSNQVDDLQAALFASTKKTLSDFRNILDFGCGSGRQTRHIINRAPQAHISGVDVDKPSIEWLQNNFKTGVFRHIPSKPPMPIENECFDLIYSVSVFTHLKPSMQEAWLSELWRVANNDCTLLITTHGPDALINLVKDDPHLFNKSLPDQIDLDREGFLFFPYIEEDAKALGIDTVYGTSFHSDNYIRNTWSRYFKILSIVPRGLDNFQDIVVLTKE